MELQEESNNEKQKQFLNLGLKGIHGTIEEEKSDTSASVINDFSKKQSLKSGQYIIDQNGLTPIESSTQNNKSNNQLENDDELMEMMRQFQTDNEGFKIPLPKNQKQENKSKMEQHSLSSNIKFDSLQFIQVIGEGSFGKVSKVLYAPQNFFIALQSITINLNEESQKKLGLQIDNLMSCNSPYIIKCYGAHLDGDFVNIALEHMDLGSLADVSQITGAFPEGYLRIVAHQVLQGLEYLHQFKKVIHRDIKPSNLLVNSFGEVQISDFGESGRVQFTLEQRRTFVGTVTYMSPERFQGGDYTVDSDLWSLGLSLVECAYGRYPYPDDGSKLSELKFWDLLNYIKNKPSPKFPPYYSNEIQNFIEVLLQKESGKRLSATELLKHTIFDNQKHLDKSILANWILGFLKQ